MLDGESCEGKVLLAHGKAVLWSGGDEKTPVQSVEGGGDVPFSTDCPGSQGDKLLNLSACTFGASTYLA